LSLQKSIIFGLALIVAVSCDVSHLQGQGWSKDENGYNYPKPAGSASPSFDEPAQYVEEEYVPNDVAVSVSKKSF
jgi:hypothetical protein